MERDFVLLAIATLLVFLLEVQRGTCSYGSGATYNRIAAFAGSLSRSA